MAKNARRTRRTNSRAVNGTIRPRSARGASSEEAIKAAEQVTLSAFASGLKLAAAFSTVAAKTTSLALASLATGADKFSELVKREALASRKSSELGVESSRTRNRRKRKTQR